LLFIFIVIVILYIFYRDLVYRDASKIKRCREIEDTIQINKSYENPYVYRVYIIQKKLANDILNNYSICFEYNFIKEITNVYFGKPENVEGLIFSDYNSDKSFLSNGFSYFSLEKLDTSFLQYDNGGKLFYINKKIITDDNYLYIVATPDNRKILDNVYAKKLAKFVKKFGFDYTTELSPIYNILYAIEHNKNSATI